jgi:alpha-methylacyl-CoA racemase
MDRSQWPAMKQRVAALVKTKTRDEWCRIMEGSDVCFAPVLAMGEAAAHPHNAARKTFIDIAGMMQPAPAPRFSRTPPEVMRPPAHAGQHSEEVLAAFGFPADEIRKLRETKAIV